VDSPSGIASRLRRTMTGPMWHGPSMQEALAGLAPADAVAHPIIAAHSIWTLVLHIGAWATISEARLRGTPWTEPTDAENFPVLPARRGAREWKAAQQRTAAAYESLAVAVKALAPDVLRETVVAQEYTKATMLHGVVEHGVYHVGQIVLLRRALGR
jgi:uncharacterized damage-inducible protein DinB